ncbi:MAG: oligosaccharide flippase family protein [Planctomycetes bacterium]|nr:oligosaccharide flippase family protein [Planctomycetota bacterium]
MKRLLSLYRSLNVRLGGFAVLDQAIVGGTNFLTTILVGRLCGTSELGLFALAMTIWYLILAFLESMITSPFTVFVHRLEDENRTTYAGSAIAHVMSLAVLATTILALGAALLYWFEYTRFSVVIASLAVTLPFRLLRHFARRFHYASLNLNLALVLDISVATLQISAMLTFYWLGLLSAAGAFLAVGAAYALVLLFWWIQQKKLFSVRRNLIFADFLKNWTLGRWLVASQISMIVAAYSLPWVIAIAIDESQTGIYSACATLVCLGAPLLVAVQNVLTPQSASAFAEQGLAGLRRVVKKATLGLALGMGCFAIFLAIAGDLLVRLFFGADYGGQQTVITLLVIAELVYALTLGAATALTVLERTDLLFRSHLVGVLVTLTIAITFVGKYGLLAAATAQFAGTTIGSAIALLCYRNIVGNMKEADLPETTR